MLTKLRRRFTGISVLLTGAALFALLALLYMTIVLYSYNSISNSLKVYTITPGNVKPYSDTTVEGDLFSFIQNVCLVSVNNKGVIIRQNYSTGNIPEATIEAAVKNVMTYNDGFGTEKDHELFYYRVDDAQTETSRISFANASSYYHTMETLLLTLIIFYFVLLLIVFAVSTFIVKLSLKPAQKAWEQQQNFIADASHELKTPLTVILTNTNILMAHQQDTIRDQIMWINSTLEESTHMKELVEKLLLLAKTDNMSQKDMFTTVDLSELAIRLSLQYEPVAFENGIILETDIQNGIYTFGEPTALNQVMHILLDNATKYAGVGGKVSLSLRKTQKEIFITCTNSGDVIPEEDLPHIFERFYRLDKVRTSGNGYGLGLAICKNLIDIHKGDITCTSNAAIGTTFTIRLKAANKQ